MFTDFYILYCKIDGSIQAFTSLKYLTLYAIEVPFNAFANRADPYQAALARAA